MATPTGNAAAEPPPCLETLPPELRDAIMEHVPAGMARIRVGCASPVLQRSARRVDGRNVRRASPQSLALPGEAVTHWLPRFASLTSLSLAGAATNTILTQLAELQRAPPALRILDVSASDRLTDTALAALAAAAAVDGAFVRQLGVLDITFCNNTTYSAAIGVRRAFPGGQIVVVRLPSWLQGHFETPWGEAHTYWADGSFVFQRSTQSAGYVRWLRAANARSRALVHPAAAFPTLLARPEGTCADGCLLLDSLQYIDFSPPPVWPAWVRFVYRPGVALRPIAAAEGASAADSRLVLVTQLLRGLQAPCRLPPVPLASVPVGQRVYARRSGEVAPLGTTEEQALELSYEYMISCMRVDPLLPAPIEILGPPPAAAGSPAAATAAALPAADDPGAPAHASAARAEPRGAAGLMPPADLVRRIEEFESLRLCQRLNEALLETVVSASLGGEDPEIESDGEEDAPLPQAHAAASAPAAAGASEAETVGGGSRADAGSPVASGTVDRVDVVLSDAENLLRAQMLV